MHADVNWQLYEERVKSIAETINRIFDYSARMTLINSLTHCSKQ